MAITGALVATVPHPLSRPTKWAVVFPSVISGSPRTDGIGEQQKIPIRLSDAAISDSPVWAPEKARCYRFHRCAGSQPDGRQHRHIKQLADRLDLVVGGNADKRYAMNCRQHEPVKS